MPGPYSISNSLWQRKHLPLLLLIRLSKRPTMNYSIIPTFSIHANKTHLQRRGPTATDEDTVAPQIKTSSNIHNSLLVVAVDDGHVRLLFLDEDAYTVNGDVDRVRWLSKWVRSRVNGSHARCVVSNSTVGQGWVVVDVPALSTLHWCLVIGSGDSLILYCTTRHFN